MLFFYNLSLKYTTYKSFQQHRVMQCRCAGHRKPGVSFSFQFEQFNPETSRFQLSHQVLSLSFSGVFSGHRGCVGFLFPIPCKLEKIIALSKAFLPKTFKYNLVMAPGCSIHCSVLMHTSAIYSTMFSVFPPVFYLGE